MRLATYLHHPNIARVDGMQKARGAMYVMTESGTSLAFKATASSALQLATGSVAQGLNVACCFSHWEARSASAFRATRLQ